MMSVLSINEVAGLRLDHFVAESLQHLLEKKHLYQNHAMAESADAVEAELGKQVSKDFAQDIRRRFRDLLNSRWRIENPAPVSRIPPFASFVEDPAVHPPTTVKVFCRICDGIEAFNPVYASDLLEETKPGTKYGIDQLDPSSRSHGNPQAYSYVVQSFALGFQCQSCKSIPEFFLIRREGLKLQLTGRNPMEKVVVPKFIPKRVSRYYSNAQIAFNSGQTLSALFQLRTLIEQYVRGPSNKTDLVDVLIDEYLKTLPDDFKRQFPSFRKIYDDLSTVIHAANASEELFTNSVKDLEKHFKARELYELPEL